MALMIQQVDTGQFLEHVAEQLKNWGRWLRAVRLPGLDFPSKSNFVFVVSGDQEFDSDQADRVEQQMALLNRVFPEQYEALYFEYVLEYSNFEGAQAMRVSVGTYRQYKSRGLSFITRGLL